MHHASVVLLLCLKYLLTSAGEEGDDCDLLAGGKGTCVNLQKCPSAVESLKEGRFPQTCGFNGLAALVCCKKTPSVKKPGALSAAKCKEYYPFPADGVLVPGGVPSLAKEFPHMAAIGFGAEDEIEWLCGGSLISKNFILTAAHCLYSRELGPARWVRLGELDFATDRDMAQPQNFSVKRRIPHPDYRIPSRYHDVALIELDREVILTEYVGISCLDTVRDHKEKQMTVTGWGKIEFAGEPSSFLLKVKLDLVDREVCQKYYKSVPKDNLPNGIVDDYHICAGGKAEQDTCQGDSGGPLQIRNPDAGEGVSAYFIVGVTSFGKACGVSRSPGVYTRVYNYLSWIEDVVWSS